MNVMIIKACFTLCLAILTSFLLVLGYKDWKLRRQREVYELQIELQTERMGDIEKYWEEVGMLLESIRHDLQKGLVTDDLLARCSSYTTEFITGVEVVDALIGYKKQLCREQNISFHADIKALPEKLLEDPEYIGLFGNLLDNAIEAAGQTENPYIKVTSVSCSGQWILKVSNSKRKDAKPLANNLATTKGCGHGMGTKIVSKIVKRHGGVIEYEDVGESFQVMVVFGI